jgi:SAM-dependent methyltransferase
MHDMDLLKYNREAWAKLVQEGNQWTVPVSAEEFAAAKQGIAKIYLTPTKPIPNYWLGNLKGKKVLCLASGGGQQGPLLTALGAEVTVFDNCPAQLEKDALVAARERYAITLKQGDMRDLSCFADETFDLIVHPVSNVFVDDILVVWRETFRVLKFGGALLSGFCNPITFVFDLHKWDHEKVFELKYKIPYSDLRDLPKEELEERVKNKEPMEFGHTLEDQIGGQIVAGFVLNGFYEDNSGWGDLLDPFIDTFLATKAQKPACKKKEK